MTFIEELEKLLIKYPLVTNVAVLKGFVFRKYEKKTAKDGSVSMSISVLETTDKKNQQHKCVGFSTNATVLEKAREGEPVRIIGEVSSRISRTLDEKGNPGHSMNIVAHRIKYNNYNEE